MSKYTYQIERGKKQGVWEYEIRFPDGSRCGWGARVGTKRELEAQLRKTCERLNKAGGGLRLTTSINKKR